MRTIRFLTSTLNDTLSEVKELSHEETIMKAISNRKNAFLSSPFRLRWRIY